MKITITIDDSTPWYAPFRTPQEFLTWSKEQDDREQRRRDREEENEWAWATFPIPLD